MTRSLVPELVCELPVFAASGLVIRNGIFYIVSDDEVTLIHGTPAKGFSSYQLWHETLPEDVTIRKKLKPDFECLFLNGASLFILPSFSRSNRVTGARVDLSTEGISGHEILELSDLRKNLEEKIPDLNIEGALGLKNELLFFQRGNGKSGTNAAVIGKDINMESFRVIHLDLPRIDNIPLTVTDATLNKNEIWFLAVAEDTESTYLDGEVKGSFLGKLNEDLSVHELIRLDFSGKPEGLAFDDSGSLFLVTDDDSREKASRLLRVNLRSY